MTWAGTLVQSGVCDISAAKEARSLLVEGLLHEAKSIASRGLADGLRLMFLHVTDMWWPSKKGWRSATGTGFNATVKVVTVKMILDREG